MIAKGRPQDPALDSSGVLLGRGFFPALFKTEGKYGLSENSSPLIRTKLHRPSVPFDVVGRDRLLRLMGRAVEVPLTLVSAPAGYGKSVLVAQWAEHCEHPVAWLSLDEDESDLRLFLQYLVAAVHTVAGGACRATEELLQATELPPPSVLGRSICFNDFEALGQPFGHRASTTITGSRSHHACTDLIGRLLAASLSLGPPRAGDAPRSAVALHEPVGRQPGRRSAFGGICGSPEARPRSFCRRRRSSRSVTRRLATISGGPDSRAGRPVCVW